MKKSLKNILNSFSFPVIAYSQTTSQEVVCNKKFLSIHDIEDKICHKEIADTFLRNIKHAEYKIADNKKVHYYLVSISELNYEDTEYKIYSLNNISKYKRTRLYRYISENIPEGIVLFDNKITYVNPAFEKLCGLSEKELYKLEFQSIFSEKSLLNFSEELDKLKSGTVGKIESEFEILYKKTKKRDVFIKVKEIFFEEKKSFLAIITNISKQKNDLIKMGELAYLDTLTGIYNRRKFDDLLKNEIARVKRYKHSLGVLYFDIDHFKKVNDNYGHNEGDYVLRKTVQEIALHIRATDIFARVGGEEFVLLLPEVTADSLVEAAEHIRKIIQDCIYEKVNHITISIGATMYKPNERGSTLIKRSDRALYKAKNTGRNRVVFL